MTLHELIDINSEQDWQKQGNYNNWAFGVNRNPCPANSILPFTTINVLHKSSNLVAEFKIRRVTILGNIKTIVQTVTLPKSVVLKYVGSTFDKFYYLAESGLEVLTTGLYEYYLKDTEGNEYISNDVFKYLAGCDTYVDTGDYDPGDYNSNDYLTGTDILTTTTTTTTTTTP